MDAPSLEAFKDRWAGLVCGVLAHGKRVGTRGSLRSLPTQVIVKITALLNFVR